MRAKELAPLFKQLLPALPGFAFHKRLLLERTIGRLLRALHFDTTGLDKDGFNVDVFVMPLCVPKEYLTFTFGKRVHDPHSVWSMKMPDLVPRLSQAIREQALPYLAQCASLLDFADLVGDSRNPHGPKNSAFALARVGEHERAIATIDALLPRLNLDVAWEQGIADETTALRHMLVTDPSEADRKLKEWESYTIQKLGLEQFRQAAF